MWYVVCGKDHKPQATNYKPQTTNHNRGFTLMEILIVIAIIVLVVSISFPLFQALRGARSTEAAQNVVSAALGYARTKAINEGRPHGVLFLVDPATEASKLWIVRRGYESTDDPDPLERYKGWYPDGATASTQERYFAPDDKTAPIQQGDRTTSVSRDFAICQIFETSQTLTNQNDNDANNNAQLKPLVRLWQTKPQSTPSYTHTPQLSNSPPGTDPASATDTSTDASATSSMSNTNWERVNSIKISRVADLEELRLPPGTGVQLMIDPGTNVGNVDRYVRTGLILFDSQGRLSFDSFMITADSEVGKALALQEDTVSMVPGFGLVAYDLIEFKRNPKFSDNDYVYPNLPDTTPKLMLYSRYFGPPADVAALFPNSYTNNEKPEEQWLDENSAPILINRYSGSLSLTE